MTVRDFYKRAQKSSHVKDVHEKRAFYRSKSIGGSATMASK